MNNNYSSKKVSKKRALSTKLPCPSSSSKMLLLSLLCWACLMATTTVRATMVTTGDGAAQSVRRQVLSSTQSTYTLNEDAQVPHIPVGPDHNAPQDNQTSATPTKAPDPSTPVLPVPSRAPGHKNHTNAPSSSNSTTSPTPTISPSPSVSPTSVAPHTPSPSPTPTTPAPTKKYTQEPTVAPSSGGGGGGSGFGFFRMIGKMISWMILMGLAVLLYGFCINNRYQIAYYARHAGHFCQSCYRYLMRKVGGAQREAGYHAMYQPHDDHAQSLNHSLLFDAPGAADPNQGFAMGQPGNNINYQQLG